MTQRARCRRCRRIKRRCACAYLCDPPLAHSLPLTLVQSHTERDHIKNSGALLAGSLADVEVIEVKLPSHHLEDPSAREQLAQALLPLSREDHFVLYPSLASSSVSSPLSTLDLLTPRASDLGLKDQMDGELADWRSLTAHSAPRLVLLDLTWGQSARLLQSAPQLASAPRVALPFEVLTALQSLGLKAYQELRSVRARSDERYSTLEAGVAALATYEYIRGRALSLEIALTEYQPLWMRYHQWIKDLERRFSGEMSPT